MQKLSPNSKGRCKRLIIIEPQKFEKISLLQYLVFACSKKSSKNLSLNHYWSVVGLFNYEITQFSEITSLSDSQLVHNSLTS